MTRPAITPKQGLPRLLLSSWTDDRGERVHAVFLGVRELLAPTPEYKHALAVYRRAMRHYPKAPRLR